MRLNIISIVFSIYHLKIIDTQETTTNIPVNTIKSVDNLAAEHVDDYHELIQIDIDDIAKELKPYEEFEYNPFFYEHKQRAKTFWLCCFSKNISNSNEIDEYLNNYKSAGNHISIILKCLAKLNGSEKEYCQKDLKILYAIRKDSRYYLSNKFKNNQSIAEQWLKRFENTDVDMSTNNIVQNYENVTRDLCDFILVLLWSPKDLIECEKKTRLSFTDNNEPIENYYTYSYGISAPYLDLSFNLLKDFKNKWQSLEGEDASHSIPDMSPSISDKTIDNDMIAFKNTLSSFSTDRELQNHPMIKHYTLRAEKYRICCGKNEPQKYFNEYLSNYAMNLTEFLKFRPLIKKCVNRQSIINPTFDSVECDLASDPLIKSVDDFHKFFRMYEEQNLRIHDLFRAALDLETKQMQIIQRERVYVDSFCQKYHVFELMFDFDKWIDCEQIIRSNLKSHLSDYYQYSNSVGKLFTTLILDLWTKMKQIIDHVDTHTIAEPSTETNHRPKIEPQAAPDYVYNNTGTTRATICLYFSFIIILTGKINL